MRFIFHVIVRRLHVARKGEVRKVYRVLVVKPEGKRPPERPRHRWKNGSSEEWLGGCGVDSAGSVQGPMAGCCERGDERSGSGSAEFVK
jgi:hypothetical protein